MNVSLRTFGDTNGISSRRWVWPGDRIVCLEHFHFCRDPKPCHPERRGCRAAQGIPAVEGPQGCVCRDERGEVFRRGVSRENSLHQPEGAAGSIGVLRLELWFAARTTALAQDDRPQNHSKGESSIDFRAVPDLVPVSEPFMPHVEDPGA